jgi:hypothetical protein
VCAAGGGQDSDPLSAEIVPRLSGGYCLDPHGEPKTYGDQAKLSMDEVCTNAFDGECEVYKRFGVDRVVTVRYVDGSGAPNEVDVSLSRFKTADGAYAMFTKRVVADGDPALATVKPLAAGAAGATSSSNAYVWRGKYLVELTFVTEDPKMTAAEMARANARATGSIAKDMGAKVPGSLDLPAGAAALPQAARLPLGIAYHPGGPPALGTSNAGPAAVGYYREGDRRWRDVAIERADAEGAKEVLRAIKAKPGAAAVKGAGDEAVAVTLKESAEQPKVEYVFARKGSLVAGVGDEELASTDGKVVPGALTRDEKIAKLAAWLK